jgi:hypothetical protein
MCHAKRTRHSILQYNRGMRADIRRLAEELAADLRQLFAARLKAVVLFGSHAPDRTGHMGEGDSGPVQTLVLVERLEHGDLDACAGRHRHWTRRGLATPLLLGAGDFARSLDAFPLEFGAILARHEVILGQDPFAGLVVCAEDVRRACEVQTRSHVLHLREAYIEAEGHPAHITRLVHDSAPGLRVLLLNLALLERVEADDTASLARHASGLTGVSPSVFASVLELTSARVQTADATRLFPEYLAAMERLASAIDRRSQA